MNILHFIILILPFFLVIVIAASVYNIIQSRKIISITDIFVIGLMIIILFWYYFPQRNVLNDYTLESITIHIKDEIITITEEVQLDEIKALLNRYSYIRNVTDTLNSTFFDTENLIRLDYNIVSKGKPSLIHFYIMYPNTLTSEALQNTSKSNRLQINEQFYSVNMPYDLSNELYNYLIKTIKY